MAAEHGCYFEWDQRWPQIMDDLARALDVEYDAALRAVAEILERRDRLLEEFISERVCCDCTGA